MSLETQLERLNENLEKLIGAMVAAPEKAAPAAKKTTAKKAPAKKAPAKKKPATRAKKINYDRDVKPQVLIAIATPEGRESVKELLAEYGASKADQIDDSDMQEFLAGIAEIIEANDNDDD